MLALRRGELPDAARTRSAGWWRVRPEIRLGPLDETAVAQVARDMLGGEPDEALRQVLSRAGGQPFLLPELLRGLRAENLVTVDGGTAKLATGAQLPHRECLFSGIRDGAAHRDRATTSAQNQCAGPSALT